MRYVSIAALALILLTATPNATIGEEMVMLDNAIKSSLTIAAMWTIDDKTFGSDGSGVAVSPHEVLTCYHVAYGNPPGIFTLTDSRGKTHAATLVAWWRKYDFALLHTHDTLVHVARIGKRTPPLGTSLYVVGSPGGITFTITGGILSKGKSDSFDPFPGSMVTDALVMPGSSGAGVFTKNGMLVATALGTFREEKSGITLGIISNTSHLAKFLRTKPKDSEKAKKEDGECDDEDEPMSPEEFVQSQTEKKH